MIALLGDQPSLSSKIMRGAEGADKRCGQPMQSAERSEEHTSELQSRLHLVCRLLLEKKQNEMLAYQQKESTARVASIMENTNLSKQQRVSAIMLQMLTQAQTAVQFVTSDPIHAMARR